MKASTKKKIEAAVVTIPKGKGYGRGVVIPGGLILTSAHCVYCECDGRMAPHGDFAAIEFDTAKGKRIVGEIWAVEPRRDVAIIGSLDGQAAPEHSLAFDEFIESVTPVRICQKQFEHMKKHRAFVLNRDRKWVAMEMVNGAYDGVSLAFSSKTQIEGGASGGPIVTTEGELLGVVSWAGEITKHMPTCQGTFSRPMKALPVWLAHMIINSSM